jgi:hypothetical protein
MRRHADFVHPDIRQGLTSGSSMVTADKTQSVLSPLHRLRHAAQAAGISCLATGWDTWKSSYPFSCRFGHQFTRSASLVILHGVSCPECRNADRLARLKQAAEIKCGHCLETTWQGADVPHRFQCARGHIWKARPRRIMNDGSWCRRCAQQDHGSKLLRHDGIERLQECANQKGGQLLDTVYAGLNARYRFSCANGHHWQAAGGEIMRGSWCRACVNASKRIQYRLEDGLARLKAAAHAKQGICLSVEYVMARAHYRFRCQKGHEWETTGCRIFRGAWCPSCAHDRNRLSIDQMRQLAEQRGGRCLSEHYKNVATKLRWECHLGHQWHAVPSTVLQGHWCAACAYLNRITNPRSKARSKYLPVKRQD